MGGKFGLAQLMLIATIGIFIGLIIVVVKSKKPFSCFVLGLIVIAVVSLGGAGDFGFFFGAVLATIIGASLIPVVYWLTAGHKKKEIGVLRTAKIFFWCALVASIMAAAR